MRLRWGAVGLGALYAAILSGSAGLAQLANGARSWRGLLFAVILLGFFFGGFVAGRGRTDDAARHGAAAAGGGFVVVQGAAVLRRVVAGEGVSVVGVAFGLTTAAVCGALGGLLATRSPGPSAVRSSARRR